MIWRCFRDRNMQHDKPRPFQFNSLLLFFFLVRSKPFYLWPSFSPFVLKSRSQSCFLSLQLDYSRILTPKFLLGWQTSTKTPRDTKERWAVNWSPIVLAHYGVPQWGRSYFVAPQGQYLKARAMEGISREIFNLRKRKGLSEWKTVCEF